MLRARFTGRPLFTSSLTSIGFVNLSFLRRVSRSLANARCLFRAARSLCALCRLVSPVMFIPLNGILVVVDDVLDVPPVCAQLGLVGLEVRKHKNVRRRERE